MTRALLGLTVLLAGCAPQSAEPLAGGPEADTLGVQPLGLVRFEDARDLAVDPAGRLYVADAGAAVVVELTPEGVPLATLGGPGSGDYAFLGPSAVDPTNGLTLYVADAGNGRIQQFSRERRLLQTIPLGEARRSGLGGEGRPVAVASGATRDLYAVDELRGVVLHWDDALRLDRVIGDLESGDGALREPVDVAVGPDGRLFVADRGHAAVLVYDAFGLYLRRIAAGTARSVRALGIHRDRLLVVLPDRVLVYGLDGRLRRALAVSLDQPLVDAALVGDALVLLTPTRLFSSALLTF